MNFNQLYFIFPLKLFNNEYIYINKKYINILYVYNKYNNISFINCIKYINNIYNILIKLFHKIKKNNTINRNEIWKSTRKPWQQKGLGKARAGSFKSPLWKGGSIIFGPKNKIIKIVLQIKKKKLNFFYIILNKRTYISFVIILSIIYFFNNIKEYYSQQKRIQGLFSKKIIYVLLNNRNIKKYFFISINLLNIFYFLKYDYIIFLI